MLKIFLFKVCLISNSLLCGLIFWVDGWAYACTNVLGRYVFCVRVGTLGYFAANPVGFRFYSVGGLVGQLLKHSTLFLVVINVLLEKKIRKNML